MKLTNRFRARPFGARRSPLRSPRRYLERLESRDLLCAGDGFDSAGGILAAGHVADSLPAIGTSSPLPDSRLLDLAAAGASAAATATFPLSDTFRLHSLPGATKRVHLDFDGHTTAGTSWNNGFGHNGQPFTTPAYSQDGVASFSDAELANIQEIYQRVVEDFIPFHVDVTTEDPGPDALSNTGGGDVEWGVRVVVGGSSFDWYGAGAGGVAIIGAFNRPVDTPVFVFPEQLGNGFPKYTAEASSHEIGHALGLYHDGLVSPPLEYYGGHGTGPTGWAPIMGVGYSKDLVQWSKGEYASANNSFQDDLNIITTTNGFGYRSDDHASAIAGATPLSFSGGTASASGIIEKNTDQDFFAFSLTGSPVNVAVLPAPISPNLDVLLKIWNSAGSLVTSVNPLDRLDASVSLPLSAGTYYLSIDGTGLGDPLQTGYTDYATLGSYSLTVGQPDGASTTSFQDGVFPTAAYAGTIDTRLRSGNPTANFGADNPLSASGSPDETILVKWDLSQVPVGSAVEAVSLAFHIANATADTYELYEARRAWVESEATWNVASAGSNWQVAGAHGTNPSAPDRGTTVLGVLTGAPGNRSFNLNAAGIAVVQTWINDPARNFGFVIQDFSASSDNIQLRPREATAAANRPKITITYNAGSGINSDRFEPNDSFAAATNFGALGDRTESGLTLHAPGNDDYFQQTALASGTLNVDLHFSHASGDVNLAVYNANQQLIGSSSGTADNEHVAVPVTAGQQVFIKVFSPGGVSPDYDLVIDVPSLAVTTSFQDGVFPSSAYAGTIDTRLRSGNPTANFGSANPLSASGSPDETTLIKWDLSQVPVGSTVQAVSLAFNVANATADTYELYEVKRAWVEGQATWNIAATGSNWQVAGAQATSGPTPDRGVTVLGVLTGAAGTSIFNLNPAGVAVVQNWINNPSANFGFVIQDYAASSDNIQLRPREATAAANRPRITITYASGSGSSSSASGGAMGQSAAPIQHVNDAVFPRDLIDERVIVALAMSRSGMDRGAVEARVRLPAQVADRAPGSTKPTSQLADRHLHEAPSTSSPSVLGSGRLDQRLTKPGAVDLELALEDVIDGV